MSESTQSDRVIPLRSVPIPDTGWGRNRLWMAAWQIAGALLVSNSMQPSSAVRRWTLRAFGAKVGDRVIIRPRVRIRFPWNLTVGHDSWIGEGVWISNRSPVTIGRDAVVSQEAFITTGSHSAARDMRTVSSPIVIEDGAWVTARCMVLGGSHIGRSAVIEPMSVVRGRVANGCVYGSGQPAVYRRHRFEGEHTR